MEYAGKFRRFPNCFLYLKISRCKYVLALIKSFCVVYFYKSISITGYQQLFLENTTKLVVEVSKLGISGNGLI